MSEEKKDYDDMNDEELEVIAQKAIQYRDYAMRSLRCGLDVVAGMLCYWAGVHAAIGPRNAHRASGMYYREYGARLMRETGGLVDFQYTIAWQPEDEEKEGGSDE